MLKLREWLSKLDESGEEMIVNLSGFPAPAPEVELVLSPRSGLALAAKDATRQTAGPGRIRRGAQSRAGGASIRRLEAASC